ncbi:MAG: MCE family protein [Prochloron sp. SP5CPC1]|nr:MCE family protein [Candidatus Paraprochloron terpiosi SP5CPC1]
MQSRTIREGSVGLLILVGLGVFGTLAVWLKGIDFNRKPYVINVTFDNANGMKEGASVHYRGFVVGKIKTISPEPNGVNTEIEIDSSDLRIPKDIIIEANQSGLIGETSIDITPKTELPQSANSTSPMAEDCNKELIVCEGDELQGEIGISFDTLLRSTERLSELYTDPDFFNNLNSTAKNTGIAAAEIAKLSSELTLLSQAVRQEITSFSTAANSITVAAKETTEQIGESAAKISRTAEQFTVTAAKIGELTSNVNGLVNENRGNIRRTIHNLEDSTGQLKTTVETINGTLEAAKIEELAQNLGIITANTAAASANLRELSQNLNDPTNIVLLQETLDSARATFANAQKITADLDELTGSPEFRRNLLDLVNGLSDLVSSMDELEEEIQTASSTPKTVN